MQRYWPLRLHQSPVVATVPEIPTFMPESEASLATEFDRHRQQLFNQNRNSGWETELNTYLDKPEDLHKDVDVVQWWQVNSLYHTRLLHTHTYSLRITKDSSRPLLVLP